MWCTEERASLPRREAKEADLTPYACTQRSHQQALWLLTALQHDTSGPSVSATHPARFCHSLRTPAMQRRRRAARLSVVDTGKFKAAFWGGFLWKLL